MSKIEANHGIIQQVGQLGIRPTDLTAIILNHLHNDHDGSLKSLLSKAPDLLVYIS
jgi:glyoxylase-like metal-dependent hydrolase (beta-lactamase superfamily II)